MIKITKKILSWTANILIGILVIIISITLIFTIKSRKESVQAPSILGYRFFTVLTGSMRPDIKPGDLIFSKETDGDSLETGHVITYIADDDILVTHRIIEVLEIDGERYYKTKGDANNVEDESPVHPLNIVGRHSFTVPKGGYVIKFLQGPIGFILLFLVPLILLIKEELKTLVSRKGKIDKGST